MPTIIPIPAFSDNYIWLLRDGNVAAIVDPGDAAPVIAYLESEGLALSAILATHHHGDHVGGIPALLARAKVPVFGPATEAIPGRTHALGEGDAIVVPGLDLRLSVLDIPGHTAGHIAFVGTGLVFSGDTLFAAGCGRLFEGSPTQMVSSLDKLAALPGDTAIYCGHEYTMSNLRFARAVEPDRAALLQRQTRDQAKRDRGVPTLPSTMAEELSTNPFLRCGEVTVRAAVEQHAGRALRDRVGVFAELRAWKNSF
ncbi:MAG: hydroxyacylglutathione hydrolase [Casimicrobiaceae bacterium]